MVDFNLEQGNPVKMDDYELVIHQIDLLFSTHKCDVLGDDEFGADYERLLYDLQLSNADMENQIRSDINKIDLRGFRCDVRVYLLQGTEQDIALVDIILKRDNEVYNKTYKIS